MALLNFGQPVNGFIQTAFVVENIRQSMADLTKTLNVGPWFLRENVVFPKQFYRGKPCKLEISLAMGYSGHMMFELIEQLNDEPSVYREVVAKRGYGFHHFGLAAEKFDETVESFRSRGYKLGFLAQVMSGAQVAYMDTTADLPGMVEVIEMTPANEASFTQMQQASVGWDGSDPVRIRKAPAST